MRDHFPTERLLVPCRHLPSPWNPQPSRRWSPGCKAHRRSSKAGRLRGRAPPPTPASQPDLGRAAPGNPLPGPRCPEPCGPAAYCILGIHGEHGSPEVQPAAAAANHADSLFYHLHADAGTTEHRPDYELPSLANRPGPASPPAVRLGLSSPETLWSAPRLRRHL